MSSLTLSQRNATLLLLLASVLPFLNVSNGKKTCNHESPWIDASVRSHVIKLLVGQIIARSAEKQNMLLKQECADGSLQSETAACVSSIESGVCVQDVRVVQCVRAIDGYKSL